MQFPLNDLALIVTSQKKRRETQREAVKGQWPLKLEQSPASLREAGV